MGRPINKLSARAVEGAKDKRRLGDGGGLWLNISASGSKSWVFRWTPKGGKPHEMGLGAYPDLMLADARKIADENRRLVANGENPKKLRDVKQAVPITFGEVADEYLVNMTPNWTNQKTLWQWQDSLVKRCGPIRSRPIQEIETDDILSVLKPVWSKTPETASRIRMRIEAVLNYAKSKKLRAEDNPALWKGHLEHQLAKRDKLKKSHYEAMPYKEVPHFIARLHNAEALAADALELLILTACRTGEALKAVWSEFDFENCIWEIPKERMKMKESHRIPLTPRAIEILIPLYESRTSHYVFPGQAVGKPLSNMSMAMLLRRMKIEDATVHGFRSSFRDWCGDETNFPREIAEAALAHKVGSDVELAYRRGDALEKRRKLMEAWAEYCTGAKTDNVVKLHG